LKAWPRRNHEAFNLPNCDLTTDRSKGAWICPISKVESSNGIKLLALSYKDSSF
jgi:hypothetical protein